MQLLTRNDLQDNLILKRKIKRMQQAEARENAQSDVEIDSEDEVAAPRTAVPKQEVEDEEEMSDAGVPATQRPPQGSAVVDLGDPSDEDDDDDEDEV